MQQQNTTKIKDSEIFIRKAQKDDLHQVIDLVKELAIYEKEPEAVTASLKEYQELFDNGWYECLVAVKEHKILGIAIYYKTFSTWKGKMMYLEDLVVSEAYRCMGIGQMLFDQVVTEAQQMGCALLKWQVLDWNMPAIKFYEKNEAIIEKEWLNGKIILDKSKYGL
jgi:ribosomal protein S18 acetylase RimI-like enzyme